jgi:manganese/zinc/iron transport system substrate-binding protein
MFGNTASASRWLKAVYRTLAVGVVLALAAAAAPPEVAAPADGSAPSVALSVPSRAKPLRVVATTGMIGDVARNVAGDRAAVTDLMGEGVDPHLYKASPGDMRTLGSAELVLFNGLHLEGRLGEALAPLAKRTRTLAVAEGIAKEKLRTPPEFEGHPDPHVWFDPMLWASAVESIRDALSAADPVGAPVYQANAEAFLVKLRELDSWARAELAAIPKERRVLVTAHDAFGYFGRAYDVEVLAIQGISTDSEASLRDMNALVDILVARKVPAVFVESSVPRKTIEALVEGCKARGHLVRVGGELFSDAVGPHGTPEGTYIGMLRHNVKTICAALK